MLLFQFFPYSILVSCNRIALDSLLLLDPARMSRNLFRDCEVVQCIVVLGRTRQVSRRSGFLGGGSHFLYGILPKLKGRPEPNVSGFLSLRLRGGGRVVGAGVGGTLMVLGSRGEASAPCGQLITLFFVKGGEDLECPFLNHLGRGQD
ncbi:unnamed protein product [Timema podura]|uniref:Uncharacterized protein n=1 Tax=Timema podura TaxID=61482 RepID=A0ABN7PFZ3_TIMPD|nr:unnamed protein product [Timema podura]